jgi:ParB family chromosome partitioning protein
MDGASPARPIDSTLIVRSKWANRHELSFSDESFKLLKDEIESAGGNVQPIKVRPLVEQGGQFEIVFGHRRHQACLELGLPVLAMISNLNDQELFTQMDQENRQRKDLRPYEQGVMYKRALDEGLFPSARKMAEAIGVDLTNLGKSLSLAKLPDAVLCAFKSPLDIQYRWVTELNQAIQKNPDVVIANAKLIQDESPRPDSKDVFDRLIKMGGSTVLPPTLTKLQIKGNSGETGSIMMNAFKKTLAVSLKNIEPQVAEEIQVFIQKHLNQSSSKRTR